MRDSRANHVALGWVPLRDWLDAANGIPTVVTTAVQDAACLALEAFPFVHVDDWLVGKIADGLAIKGWLGVGNSQIVDLEARADAIRLATDPEMVAPFTTALDDETGLLGWFSEAAAAAPRATIRGTVLDARAFRFTCRKSGTVPSGWEGADFEANLRRNVFRVLDAKGAPMGPWLHPPFDETPVLSNGRRPILADDGTGWIAACELANMVRFVSVKEFVMPPPKPSKADPNAPDLSSMDFKPGAAKLRGLRSSLFNLGSVKSDPEVEELMRFLDDPPDGSKIFK